MNMIYRSLAMVLACAVGQNRSDLIVRFSEDCRIEDAAWSCGRLYLKVARHDRYRSMAVAAVGCELVHWDGRIDFDDVQALGRLKDDLGVVAIQSTGLDGRPCGWRFFEPSCNGSPRQFLAALSSEPEDGVLRFLPSGDGWYVTRRRAGVAGERTPRVRFDSLQIFDAADRSGKALLVGRSARKDHSGCVQPGSIGLIDLTTGAARELAPKVKSRHSQNGAPSAVDSAFDVTRDQVSAVLADPKNADRFYVSLGTPLQGGRLLRIGRNGECEVIFSRRIEASGIAGAPSAVKVVSMPIEEPVLAMCVDADKALNFVTVRGVYRLRPDDSADYLGAPRFETVGGFCISQNIQGLVLVLSEHSDARGGAAATRAKAFLLAKPGDQGLGLARPE